MDKTISYVITMFNEEKRAKECIDSLLAQKTPSLEILVYDDGSTDKTNEILKSYGKKIKLFTNKDRLGAAVNWNRGNKKAKGDYVSCSGCDFNYPNRNCVTISQFAKDKELEIIHTDINWKTPKNEASGVRKAVDFDGYSKCTFNAVSATAKPYVWLENPYPELSIETDCYEDVYINIARKKYKCKSVHKITVLWGKGSSNRIKREALEIRQNIYNKYGISVRLY